MCVKICLRLFFPSKGRWVITYGFDDFVFCNLGPKPNKGINSKRKGSRNTPCTAALSTAWSPSTRHLHHTYTAPTLRPTPTVLHDIPLQKEVSHVHLGSLQRPFWSLALAQLLIPLLCVNCAVCNMRPVLCFFPHPPYAALLWTIWQASALPSRKSAHLSTRRTASAHWEKSRSCCVSTMRISSASMIFLGHGKLTTWGMCIL